MKSCGQCPRTIRHVLRRTLSILWAPRPVASFARRMESGGQRPQAPRYALRRTLSILWAPRPVASFARRMKSGGQRPLAPRYALRRTQDILWAPRPVSAMQIVVYLTASLSAVILRLAKSRAMPGCSLAQACGPSERAKRVEGSWHRL